jgi:hypothetical protein
MALSSIVRIGLACAVLAGIAQTASAQQRSSPPFIVIGENDIDPATYDWQSEGARNGLQGAIDALKAGTLSAFVFAAAPGGDFWTFRFAAKPTDPYSLSDLGRQALQSCEYLANGSCFIVSVNGKEARDADGSLRAQPRQLRRPPATFDSGAIPFLGRDEQLLMKGYGLETKPRAMFITSSRGAVWRTGENTAAAVATTLAECQRLYPNAACIIYAVNDRVVFNPGGPY